MQTDFLIIGQGICGTWLSYYLQKEGKSFLILDNNRPLASSRLAAGVINPVTGRRYSTTWMAENLLPFVKEAYNELGALLQTQTISHTSIIDFFPSPQMRLSFLERLEENNNYLRSFPEQNHFNSSLRYDFGCGEIAPVHIVHLENILPAWHDHVSKKQRLIEEEFDHKYLEIESDGIRYKDITAGKIIFCDGYTGASNPYFATLPFAPSKGELLIVEIEDLAPQHIYKKGLLMVPMSAPGLFWIGSSYLWEYDDEAPTRDFRVRTEEALHEWLRVPYRILEHKAGIRPSTLERRPFVGIHPSQPEVGILNGMGTKGCSLAPWFAKELVDYLLYNKPITLEADVSRFRKVLARKYS